MNWFPFVGIGGAFCAWLLSVGAPRRSRREALSFGALSTFIVAACTLSVIA